VIRIIVHDIRGGAESSKGFWNQNKNDVKTI
jgi:hypothetical protein